MVFLRPGRAGARRRLPLAGLLLAAPLASQQPPPIPERGPGDIEIAADTQESVGERRFLRGRVEVRLDDTVVNADEIDYNQATGEMEARGNVRYRNSSRQEDLHAEKFNYNFRTESGTFHDVYGTVGSASQGGTRLLTTDNPFYIEGKAVDKADGHYTVHDGLVTNCDADHPWWTLKAPRAKIRPGQSATIYRGLFRLRKVPVFYFPIFKKSLKRLPRRSGFLTPNIGNSSRFGLVFGQSYYWAVNRSYDATVGGTWYTNRGVAGQMGFRGRPTANSHFDAYFFGVKDRGLQLNDGRRIQQGGHTSTMRGSAMLPGRFRGVAELNHLSSLEFRQAFTQSFDEAVFSQVRSIGFVTKNFSTFSLNAAFLRNENFQSVRRGDTVLTRKLPSVEFNSRDRSLLRGPLPVWFSLDSAFELVSRTQPLFQTRRYVQRGDLHPRVTAKWDWGGFHFTPSFGARSTSYGQSRAKDGSLTGRNLYRNTRDFSVDIAPPALERIMDAPRWLGKKIKHVIEPRLAYRFVDGVEDFDRVVRFDTRDLVHDTNEAELALTNRIYAKDAAGRVREVFNVGLRQRRFFDPEFGGALFPGRRNVLDSSLGLTPFAFADQARNYSPIAATLRVSPSWRHALEWRYDYDPLRGKVVNSSVSGAFRFDRWNLTLGHHAVRTPDRLTPPSNQLFTVARLGDFNRRGWNLAVSNIYDYRQTIFLYTAIQGTYNTDCCGFSGEWRRFAIGTTRNDNQIRFSFSIANVGSFGTLRPRERLF